MPIYEYACPRCDHRFELRRGMSAADDPVDCPACQSPEVQRLISRVVCFSKGEGGQMASVGGGGCGGCAGSSCGSCHH
jgi:putative FmdB family regulatory protein